MTWIDSGASYFADDALHAAITRQDIQGNLQTVYDESGYDNDCGTLSAAKTVITVGATWGWATASVGEDEFVGYPILIRRPQGEVGWRTYTIEILGSTSSAGTVYVHAFLLPGIYGHLDASAGTVGSFNYATLTFDSTDTVRHTDDTKPTDVSYIAAAGTSTPIVWVALAVKGDVDLNVYSIRISESS